MPWEFIVLPIIFSLIYGFKSGIKMKAGSGYKRPAKFL